MKQNKTCSSFCLLWTVFENKYIVEWSAMYQPFYCAIKMDGIKWKYICSLQSLSHIRDYVDSIIFIVNSMVAGNSFIETKAPKKKTREINCF